MVTGHGDSAGGAGSGSPESPLAAALDLGSNSFHMILGRLIGDQLMVVDRMRDPVRLAAGLDQKNLLNEATMERALESLERMGQRLRELRPSQVRAIGTNTFRRARASRELLERAGAALGFPIEILSGPEEARLIHLGVSHHLPRIEGRRLVVDIGGGSTECILGQGFRPIYMDSLHMGCVAHTRRFFGDGKITREAFRAAELAAKLELESLFRRFIERGWEEAVGSSGTIKSVALALQTREWTEGAITLAGIKKLRRHMIASERISRLDLPELQPDRVQVLPGGVAILKAVFEKMEIESMYAVKAALREGVLYDLFGRIRQEDVRDRTIRSLSQRYDVDEDHADRVSRCARHCLQQVAGDWGLEDDDCGQLLSWAAQLHEIGLTLSYSSFHRHGEYLLTHSNMPGFSRQEQERLALLVRSHRRKLYLGLFDEQVAPWDERCLRLAVLLRIAVRLNRMRSRAPLPRFGLARVEGGLEISLPAEWLESHPLTRADLEDEARFLASAGLPLRVRTSS